LFKEKFVGLQEDTSYSSKGTGILPKLNSLSSGNTRYGRLAVTYGSGNTWRLSTQRHLNESAINDKVTANSSNLLPLERPRPLDYVLPAELKGFILDSPHEFQYLMNKSCKLLYLRLNNSRLNYFSKSGHRYYSSVFFDCKTLLSERPEKKPFDLYAYFQEKYPSLPR